MTTQQLYEVNATVFKAPATYTSGAYVVASSPEQAIRLVRASCDKMEFCSVKLLEGDIIIASTE